MAGAAAFATLVTGGAVRPFRVADDLGLGALAFIAGRLVVVVAHELAHALTLASFGRRPRRLGFKLLGIVPYAFVDTSEAWFEGRSRRIAVAAAGPIADTCLAGLFALVAVCAAASRPMSRTSWPSAPILGTLLNLNPLLDRDGYQILVDVVREPGLRRRARDRIAGRLAAAERSRSVALYALAMLAAAVVTAAAGTLTATQIAGRGRAVAPWHSCSGSCRPLCC